MGVLSGPGRSLGAKQEGFFTPRLSSLVAIYPHTQRFLPGRTRERHGRGGAHLPGFAGNAEGSARNMACPASRVCWSEPAPLGLHGASTDIALYPSLLGPPAPRLDCIAPRHTHSALAGVGSCAQLPQSAGIARCSAWNIASSGSRVVLVHHPTSRIGPVRLARSAFFPRMVARKRAEA
jgi:hypothetical protein